MPTSKPIFSAIAAMSDKRVIGQDNRLPWHLPADLRHFKALTTGHPIIMGRKTYDSIGRPLPNRVNIIITRNTSFQVPAGCIQANSPEEALAKAEAIPCTEIFVIGGANIYQQTLPLVSRLYLTMVHHEVHGDAYFPKIDKSEWREVSCEEHQADGENEYDYGFVVWERYATT